MKKITRRSFLSICGAAAAAAALTACGGAASSTAASSAAASAAISAVLLPCIVISPGQKSKAAEQPQKKRSPGRKGCGRGCLRTARKKKESGYEQ